MNYVRWLAAAGTAVLCSMPMTVTGQGSIPAESIADRAPGQDSNGQFVLPYEYRRQAVFYRTTEQPGTIIVNTSDRFLYLVQGDNRAIRYGVGVGRDGFQWGGVRCISAPPFIACTAPTRPRPSDIRCLRVASGW